MILVDTSVWIEFFRGASSAKELIEVLDEGLVALAAPVWIELLSGARRDEKPRLRKVLSALPRLYPLRSTWSLMEKMVETASRKGHRFGSVDLLIAAIAVENDASVWSLDSDFARMGQLKILRLH